MGAAAGVRNDRDGRDGGLHEEPYELVRRSVPEASKQDTTRGAVLEDVDVLASLLIVVTDGLQLQYLHNKKIVMKHSFTILQEALDLWLAPSPPS